MARSRSRRTRNVTAVREPSKTDVTGDLPDRYPIGFAIAPDSDDTVYITFGGFGTGHVFKSIDGGDRSLRVRFDDPKAARGRKRR